METIQNAITVLLESRSYYISDNILFITKLSKNQSKWPVDASDSLSFTLRIHSEHKNIWAVVIY